MSALDAVAEGWFRWIVPATWQLALLATVVALLCWATRAASPRLRYAMWLLVLVKVFLPPSLTAVWGVGHWGLSPLWSAAQPAAAQFLEGPQRLARPTDLDTVRGETVPTTLPFAADNASGSWPLESLLFFTWFGGAVLFAAVLLWKYNRLVRSTASMERIDEGPLRIRLEKIAAQISESQVPDLFISSTAASPFLYGLLRPAIVLPQQVAKGLSAADVNNVLLHELTHWRRRDPWIGWVQATALSLFWFHPLLWWANARLRHERECVCDEAVLRSGECKPDDYGQALLSVISLSGGRSQVQGSLVGVFERATNIQNRLEEIMSYQPGKREFGLLSLVAIGAFATVFLPMGLSQGIAQQQADQLAAVEPKQSLPERVLPGWSAAQAVGAPDTPRAGDHPTAWAPRDTDAGAEWLDVKFAAAFPAKQIRVFESFNPGAVVRATWFDAKGREIRSVKVDEEDRPAPAVLEIDFPLTETAVERVRLELDTHRVAGWNQIDAVELVGESQRAWASRARASSSFAETQSPPMMVASTPRAGKTDVDPSLSEITVTFDRDMQMGGMSWTGGPPLFPPGNPYKKPYWRDSRTCVLPVQLKAGQVYRVGINSTSYKNFQSARSEAAVPSAVFFTTRGASKKLQQQVKRPKIVKLVPANSAADVDPNLKALRVTFDMPMGGGMSPVGTGEHFPMVPGGKKPYWTKNGRTCVLPVQLKPDWQYEIGLNSLRYTNFTSKWRVPLEPVLYRFQTSSTSTREPKASSSGADSRTKRMRYFVEKFFQNNFRDVKRRQTVEWGPVTRDDEGNWSIQYKYSTKIWDKDAMMMNQVFTFTPEGEFVGQYNVEGYPQDLEDDATE